MKQAEVKELFEKYKTAILFDYFAKLDHIAIEKANVSSVQYKVFAKFATQLQVVHSLISLEDLQVIFKQVIKDKPKTENTTPAHLDYDDFLEAITRIAVISKEKLENETNEAMAEAKSKQKGIPPLNMKGMTVAILEKFLKFIGLDPSESKISLVNKLKEGSSKAVGLAQKIKKADENPESSYLSKTNIDKGEEVEKQKEPEQKQEKKQEKKLDKENKIENAQENELDKELEKEQDKEQEKEQENDQEIGKEQEKEKKEDAKTNEEGVQSQKESPEEKIKPDSSK